MDIDNFLNSHRYSANTKERYARILRDLAAHNLAAWTATDLINYVQKEKWGGSMRSLALHTIKKYIRFTFGSGHAALTAKLKAQPSAPQIVLDMQQARDLLALFDPHTAKGARDLALCALALDTGLRASELARLEPRYVNMEKRTLKVIVKRGQWGTAVFSEATANCLYKWLAYRDPAAPTLFYSLHHVKRGQPLNRDGIRQIVKSWGKQLGTHITPHALRRSFATLATVLGAPTRIVQVAGRWGKIETVEKYTRQIQQELIAPYLPGGTLLEEKSRV